VLTSAACRIMKTRVLRKTPGRKPWWRSAPLRNRSCRGCPWRGPGGACLDPVLQRGWKSGHCGGWIWCLRDGKQYRRPYAKPHDPRTGKQRRCRRRLSVASQQYSSSLTEQEIAACIAAGAKRRSRPRLNQSGRLTGQQYWIQKEFGQKAQVSKLQGLRRKCAPQVPQPQRVTRSTWDRYLNSTRVPPDRHRGTAGRPGKGGVRSKHLTGSHRKARLGVSMSPLRSATLPTRVRGAAHVPCPRVALAVPVLSVPPD
jgi:hypothetical protein